MSKISTIIGKFVGKCCDGDVVNSNGMYLSRELFQTLMDSDEYKKAIENGYYIGFLGHPEDPDNQDYRNGCIVMTDMYMENNGDIIGEFNLIDTPVGRIVKAFIDAGVKFGISIRGAGDVASDGTVDPDSFVFRGYDLVSFPAYEDCVPEFEAIAASKNRKRYKKYRNVCAAVKKDAHKITSKSTLKQIKAQFNENSDEYQEISDMELQLEEDALTEINQEEYIEVLEQKVEGLTSLYVHKVQENMDMCDCIDGMQEELFSNTRASERARQISASQTSNLQSMVEDLQKENRRLNRQVISAKKKIESKDEKIHELITANKKLENDIQKNETTINNIKNKNLIYQQRINANEEIIDKKDESLKNLQRELDKTVVESSNASKDASNLEDEIASLRSTIEAHEHIIHEYQQAYADSVAYAAGISVTDIPITADTSVSELKSYIYSNAASGVSSKMPTAISGDGLEDEYDDDYSDEEDEIIAL